MELLLAMFLYALVGAISPGPVNMIATNIAANQGFKAALPHVCGATFAYSVIVLSAGLGLTLVFTQWPQLLSITGIMGGLFLLYLSCKNARSDGLNNTLASEVSTQSSLLAGALAQVLNPKAWLVSMAGVSLFVTDKDHQFGLAWFVGISFFMCFIGISSWAWLGHGLQAWLVGRRRIYFNWVSSALLVVSVLTIWLA